MPSNDSFQFVSRRKRGKRFPERFDKAENFPNTRKPELDPEHVLRKINAAADELNHSEYRKTVCEALTKSLKLLNIDKVEEIVCYGLGHFSEHAASRYQLALLLIFKELFHSEVFVHDPIFFEAELNILESLGLEIIAENEEGKRKITRTTVVYMPHCPKQLTNNFLYANWGPGLSDSIILSNSCAKILDSHTNRVLEDSAGYILRIAPYLTELALENRFKYTDVFNDFALHIFTEDCLKKVPTTFWEEKEEPEYRREDIEFVTNQIAENLKL